MGGGPLELCSLSSSWRAAAISSSRRRRVSTGSESALEARKNAVEPCFRVALRNKMVPGLRKTISYRFAALRSAWTQAQAPSYLFCLVC